MIVLLAAQFASLPSEAATPASPSPPTIILGYSIAVARTESGFLLVGRTSLSTGTKLKIVFGGKAGQRTDVATVGPGGQFYAGEFLLGQGRYVPWPIGQYAIDIYVLPLNTQPNFVQYVSGQNWSNYSGPLWNGAGSGTLPKFTFDFAYRGGRHFVFWKSAPAGAQIARPDLQWAQTGIENRMMARIARAVQADSSSATQAATAGPSGLDAGNLQTVSRASFGCVHREYMDKLAKYRADNDREAWMSALQAGTNAGECAQFAQGDRVYLDDTALFSGLVKIRKRGETVAYWTIMEAIK